MHGGGEEPTTAEGTFGERVRALRFEKGLSQPALGALMPEPRHLSWVSKIELNQQEPTLADLAALAAALDVDVRWLLTGEASGMTEFVARMSEMEPHLDGRATRQILAITRQIIDELREHPQ